MDTKKLRKFMELAYGKPPVAPPRRSKPSAVPGWLFDATVVAVLLVLAADSLAA